MSFLDLFSGFSASVDTNQIKALISRSIKLRRNGISVSQVTKNKIVLKGKYTNKKREYRTLYVEFNDGKAFFKDGLSQNITHIKQGVEDIKVVSTLKNIYNIV